MVGAMKGAMCVGRFASVGRWIVVVAAILIGVWVWAVGTSSDGGGSSLEVLRGRLGQLISSDEALRREIWEQARSCWNPPAGVSDGGKSAVRIRIELDRYGQLAHRPLVFDWRRVAGDRIFGAHAESAVAAVWGCAPFELPTELYESWRAISVVFPGGELFD